MNEFENEKDNEFYRNFYKSKVFPLNDKKNFRFSEVEAKLMPIRNKLKVVGLYDCWASSRLLFFDSVDLTDSGDMKHFQGLLSLLFKDMILQGKLVTHFSYPCVTSRQ